MGANKQRGGRRDNRVERAVMALLEHTSMDKAAAASGISTVTLWRWTQQEEFQARLRKARRQAYSQCISRLQQASSAAVGTLLRVMTDQTAPAASRVRAAHSVLDHAARAIEMEDFEVRLSELERVAAKSTEESE